MATPDYLEGAIDLHVHSAPDLDPRRFTDIELATEAKKAGMGAILLKSHLGSTVERAALVASVVRGMDVFGGLTLNYSVGGLNPAAVDVALRLGARQIWMPTRSAANHRRHEGMTGGICIIDDAGNLIPAAREIVDTATAANCPIGTGHLSPQEVFALAQYGDSCEIPPKFLLTHPEWHVTYYSVNAQRRLAEFGTFTFERCFVSTTHRCGFVPIAAIATAISEVGIGTTILSTDLGQPDTPPPVEGLRRYGAELRALGFSASDLHRMMHITPRAFLGELRGARVNSDRV